MKSSGIVWLFVIILGALECLQSLMEALILCVLFSQILQSYGRTFGCEVSLEAVYIYLSFTLVKCLFSTCLEAAYVLSALVHSLSCFSSIQATSEWIDISMYSYLFYLFGYFMWEILIEIKKFPH